MEDFQDKNDILKIQKDILWGMYQEYRTHARHSETLRSTVNNILIVASAGLVSLSTYDQQINRDDLPATFLLIGFGILGILFSSTYTERYFRSAERAAACRQRLDELFFSGSESSHSHTLEGLRNKAYENLRFLKFSRTIRRVSNNHILWVALPFFVSIIGVLLTVRGLSTKA